ncbi:MAG: RecQ family ATP-dependent DNA helicase [Waddliaceae bacterium]
MKTGNTIASDISRQQLTEVLRERFGFEQFRPGQLEAISRLLEHRSILCIHPTAFGKSLLYQLPSTLFPGMTVVISPLLALIRDQMEQLNHRFHLSTATLNSDQTEEENEHVRALVQMKQVKILFIAPEQLDHLERYAFLLNLPVSLLVVDEAHCISTWGHDFRPSYRHIVQYTKELQQRNSQLYVLGLTATANANTEKDIRQQLGSVRPMHILREKLNRPNIALSVIHANSLTMKLALLAQVIQQQAGCGIVYCATREHTGVVADFLREQGIKAVAYHAGLASEEKKQLQEDFVHDTYKILAATNALGMGIDKQNLRFIIHFDFPGSTIAYYQEVGRCGRDGKPARGILFYDPADRRIQEHFIKAAQPKSEDFASILAVIRAESQPLKLIDIKRATGSHPTLTLVAVAELVEQGFLTKQLQSGAQVYQETQQPGEVDLSRYQRQFAVKNRELNAMIAYANLREGCRMEYLRRALGDQQTNSCGQCCLCQQKVSSVAVGRGAVDRKILTTIDSWIEERVVEIPESKVKQSSMSSGIALLDGKLRTPAFVDFMKNRTKSPEGCFGLPENLITLLKAQVEQLASKRRISAILSLPSRTWGAREEITTLIARHLGVPAFLDVFDWKNLPQCRQGELKNNDQRKANVKERMTIRKAPSLLSFTGVLLLDDYIGSGATIKEAVRVLRKEAKFSGEITPFVLAQVRWKLGSAGMI